jgi:hypothetical protein
MVFAMQFLSINVSKSVTAVGSQKSVTAMI